MANHVWTLKTVRDRCKDDGDCWIWQQATIKGYPQASIDGNGGTMVRRWVWLNTHEKAPNGCWRIVSSCDDNLCCNPEHLKIARPSQITAKGWQSGGRDRQAQRLVQRGRFIAAGLVKLSMEQARAIRCDERSARVIAAEYGVTAGHIHDIRRHRTWKESRNPVSSVFALAGAL